MKKQLLERDRDGLTVAMHAARAGHLVVLEMILKEIRISGVSCCCCWQWWWCFVVVVIG